MGHKTLVYKQKIKDNLNESYKHLERLNGALGELKKQYIFPLKKEDFLEIVENIQNLAYCDQCIYRFSKLQDSMGAKLFKSILLYQGENINKPFLDILNQLEAINIITVDEWFEIRDLQNEIAHDYNNDQEQALNIINAIYKLKRELENILASIQVMAA